MQLTPLAIPDVLLIEPKAFGDARGFFFESYNQEAFEKATGVSLPFVQDNHSRSVRGVLRGLHYQVAPRAQGKLVRAVSEPVRSQLLGRVRAAGFRFVSLDLAGIQSGAFTLPLVTRRASGD